jgi:hypothetical protein
VAAGRSLNGKAHAEPTDNREETTMLRKLLLAGLLSAGVMSVTAIPASAHEPRSSDRRDRDRDNDRDRDRHRVQFRVLVRHGWHWDVEGVYRDRDDAERVARRLERRGFDTRIERVRGW